jgi:hypothetical protein
MAQNHSFRLNALLILGLMTLPGMHLAQAIPANPAPLWLEQPDGSRFKAHRWGDERQHGYETDTGFTILQDPDTRVWMYARQRCDGQLIPSTDPVGTHAPTDPAPSPLKPHLRPSSTPPTPCEAPASSHPKP